MTETIDLPDDVMTRAAQDFFATEWASAREGAGLRFRPGANITDESPAQDNAKLLELVRPYVARLTDAWGIGVGAMLSLMEIPEGRWADALYLVLMSCRGHGIGLANDFGDNIDIAEAKLSKDIDPSPFLSEFTGFGDLASEVVGAEARQPDDPDPDALSSPATG
jgi:hypothetical protein